MKYPSTGNQYRSHDSLAHFGIKGQKWGVRRYQNEDGTLTEEGRLRYLGSDWERNSNIVPRATYDVYSKAVDRANPGLNRINKEFDNKYGKDFDIASDDLVNLEYTKQVRDLWQESYRDTLAKDIGTDPSTLKGQKWLDDMFGYRSNFDEEVIELEKKIKASEKKEQKTKRGTTSSVKNDSGKVKSDSGHKDGSTSVKKYANKKMSQSQAINQAYEDLEKKYPNFNSFSQDKQDKLFFNYLNESGLYKWV